ncbi:MAG: c-type cytochrome [Aquabacterium sp.]|nr:c-type cytochrome [Aquabacterium sp.]
MGLALLNGKHGHATSRLTRALCLVGALLGTAAAAQPAAPGDAPALLSAVLALPADAARGKEAFEECQGCHRRDASGRAGSNIPRLSAQHASVIVKQILDIRSGLRSNPPMKPYVEAPVLSLQAIADIARYLQGLPVAGNIVKGDGSDAARGQQLYARDCVACHGAAGEGNADLQVPMLAAQHQPYLLRELGLIRDGRRGNSNPAMAALIQGYTAADLQAVANHLAQLPAPGR